MTPYQYVTNNPIMFTDPTGMEQVGGGDPRKNIVINFLRNEKSDNGYPLGNYDNKDMNKNGWEVIDVSSIEDANTKLKNYLGNSKADNIYINAHGGVIDYEDSKGNVFDSSSGINLGGTVVTGRSLELYNNGNFNELDTHHKGARSAIESLSNISNMINDGKNLIFGSCNSGIDNRFSENISKMNSKIDVFITKDFNTIMSTGGKTSFKDFGMQAITKENFKHGFSQFRSGNSQRSGFNIQMNNSNGLRIIP